MSMRDSNFVAKCSNPLTGRQKLRICTFLSESSRMANHKMSHFFIMSNSYKLYRAKFDTLISFSESEMFFFLVGIHLLIYTTANVNGNLQISSLLPLSSQEGHGSQHPRRDKTRIFVFVIIT